jgi:hypothetical protein
MHTYVRLPCIYNLSPILASRYFAAASNDIMQAPSLIPRQLNGSFNQSFLMNSTAPTDSDVPHFIFFSFPTGA